MKDWQEFWNSVQGKEGGEGEDDDDEAHDINGDTGKTKTKGLSKKTKKGEAGAKKEITHDDDDDEDDDLTLNTKEENKKGKRKKSEEDEDDEEPYDEGSWDEPSSEIEHGRPPPRKPIASSYHPDKDFDPLPSMSKNQKYIRIRLRR